jgi:two-component system, chemotaxis family, protein-glutamate methylesterase/glutaminase
VNRIRVLVVDDSAFARKVIRDVLVRDREIEVVGIARDGVEALDKIAELRPDVVTLDLLMPDLDGLGVLRALGDDAPRVIVVSIAPADSELAIEALERGAVDVVTKPTALATDRLYELSSELVGKVKIAAGARPRLGAPARAAATPRQLQARPGSPSARLVVIGTSTGGPQALTKLFATLPAPLPIPIAIALHIPSGYTKSLAARLSQLGATLVHEAVDGMELCAGQAVLAPGGLHLRVNGRAGRLYAALSRDPVGSLHHPSVDVLFESAAEQVGNGAIALVMTGMGDDGLAGATAIQRAGGRVLAESAASCIVYGMPRSVIEAGVATRQARLEQLPELLIDTIFQPVAAARP